MFRRKNEIRSEMFYLVRKIVHIRISRLVMMIGMLGVVVGGGYASIINLHFNSHAVNAAQNDLVTFTPGVVDAQDPKVAELNNPERGAQYYGSEAPPPNWPMGDLYARWCWNKIETSPGTYDFTLIENGARAAKAAGYKFGFRIMPINPGVQCLPADMVGNNFSSSQYVQRATQLIQALGARYNNDPRIGWLDMGMYGCWGEWHLSCGSNGQDVSFPTITESDRQTLIDTELTAFSNKPFFMMTADQVALNYALTATRSQPVGVRIDCLGTASLGGALNNLTTNTLEANRWQSAPLYFEFCNNSNLTLALQQIKTYHASFIGDGEGNLQSFSAYSLQDQQTLIECFKASGYSFALNTLNLPGQLAVGQPFTVTSQWNNSNSAPAYHAWQVLIQLRDTTTNSLVWQGNSKMDLQTLLPGHSNTASDSFTLANVANGQYNVSVQVVDPQSYYQPLKLAIQGGKQSSDGSWFYPLGTITVGGTGGTQSPTDVASPTATSTATPTAISSPTAIPTATPSPTATVVAVPTSQYRYSFEDGGTDGWYGDFVDVVKNNQGLAQDGEHSLAVEITSVPANHNPQVYTNTWQGHAAMPGAGKTITMYVYIPAQSSTVSASILVEEDGGKQDFTPYETVGPLKVGVWNKLAYTVPANLDRPIVEYGVGFSMDGGWKYGLTAYIDSVDW